MPSAKSSGFTLVEIMVVLGLFLLIFGMMQINLTGLISEANVESEAAVVVSDFRRQQLEAMNGSTAGGTLEPKGIHFSQDSYTLFSGSVYDPDDPANFRVDLADGVQFDAITLPTESIIFEPLSGEVQDYASTSATLDLVADSGQRMRITTNALGVAEIEKVQ